MHGAIFLSMFLNRWAACGQKLEILLRMQVFPARFNYQFQSTWLLDICFPSENILLSYDIRYWHASSKAGNLI